MTEYPGQELPVPTCPPVITQGSDVVAGREFLHNLDIGGETRTGENAFEQVVAEKRRIRHPAGKCGLESIDVLDALAGIGALAEQVLIDVGDCAGVGVDPADAGEDTLKERALASDG